VAGEPFTFNPVAKVIAPDPQDIIDDPQLLADWIYNLAIEIDKNVQTDITASKGVILVGTDFQHEDTSSISDVDTSGAQVVDKITFDTFGHLLTFTTRNLTPTNIGAEPAFTKNTAFNKDFGVGGVQAGDAGLDSIAALVTAADTMIFTTALDTYDTTIITTFGRSLVDDATASDANDTLGLGTGDDVVFNTARLESLRLTDAITAPSTIAGVAQIYVDTADGDLKVKFGDGFVAVIAADS